MATYAIVKTGGKQYKVAVGDVVKVEKLESEPGAKVSLPVALVVDGATVTTDAAALAKVAVTGEVLEHTKGPKIRVVGWARNFAVVYDAMVAYKKLKPDQQPKEPINDDILNVPLPNPLPSIGAKVKITGAYNVAKTVVSDMVSEPTTMWLRTRTGMRVESAAR